ncbi:hypothetical protein JCM5353_001374 [Sporobolomyces roseus]
MAPPLSTLGRTSVVGWSPSNDTTSQLFATGTVSGALDDSFSTESLLELWEPFTSSSEQESRLEPIARISAPARFNRISWGGHGINSQERPLGVIAGGMENGQVALWDPSIALHHSEHDPLITKFESHSGPVRGLDFSSAQSNLLASGATNGELFIYDLSSPNTKPFSPGPRSRSLDTITSLSWNPSVVHILASGSNSGYTVVWDLKSKREITALSYAGAGPTGLGAAGFGAFGGGQSGGMFGGSQGGASGVGGLGGVSSVKWHPENPTKLVTASDDDHSPVILLWDLRNWKEPERVLKGHDKGILSVAWCKDDSDLIISSGKDGRTIAWGASTGEIVAEVSPSTNWAFDTAFCPRNPSIISTASLDGTVSLHSLQSTNTSSDASAAQQPSSSAANPFDSSSVFEQAISANAANHPTKSLSHAPKWLKRPASVAFGFGGKLVHIHHDRLPAVSGGGFAPAKLEIKNFVTSQPVVDRAAKLEQASTGQLEGGLAAFCDERTAELEREGGASGEVESWKLLKTLFRAAAGGNASQNREQLIELLGFDKDGVREKIEEAVSRFRKEGKLSANNSQPIAESADPIESISSQRSEADVREEENVNGLGNGDGSSSLFGDNSGGAGDDFFSQIGAGSNNRLSALPERLLAKEGGSLDGYNSAAATIGSTSSIASLNLKPSTFKLYRPSSNGDGADNTNRLITQALVVGDFNSAVSLALATERYADALLFALRGGAELLAQTQSAYFARAQQDASTSGSASYLRVLESITMNDLSDIVQNADLEDWIEVFVLLCTYAVQEEEFGSLVEQLGQRLEYQFQLVRGSPNPAQSDEWRKNAVLCYLAAGKLEKVVGVWIGQMKEEEAALKSQLGGSASASASFEAHARALQDFVEKVQVFQHAVGYIDVDLQSPTQSTAVADYGARTYKLASLYERYVEYAELLAEQGLLQLAVKYINLTPSDFEGTKPEASGPALARERLLKASGIRRTAASYGQAQPQVQQQQATSRYASAYGTPQQSNLSSSTRSAYNPYGAPSSIPAPSAVPAPTSYNPYAAPPSLSASTSTGGPSPYSNPAAVSNPYAPAPTAADNPYAPPPVTNVGVPSSNPYGSKPPSIGAPSSNSASFAPAFPSQAQGPVNDPYAPTGTPGSGLPAPPAVREASPNFANRQPVAASAPPPPRSKPEHGWNDAPVLSRKSTPAAGASSAASKMQAITSPFPNMPSAPPTSYGAYNGQPGQIVPPPPPSRGSNRTPAPPTQSSGIAPPPMTGSRFVAPPPPSANAAQQMQPPQQRPPQQQQPMAPPPAAPSTSGFAPPPSNYAPPPPAQASQNQYAAPPPPPSTTSAYAPPPPPSSNNAANGPPRQGFPAAPPPRSGTPGNSFRPPPPPGPPRSTATLPPGPPNFPRPPSAGANRAIPPPQSNGAVPPVPNAPPQFQSMPPPPPPPAAAQQGHKQAPPQPGFTAPPRPPQSQGSPVTPQSGTMATPPPPPPPPTTQMRPEPPRLKYPPGDRSHIPSTSRPIFDILSLELRRLRQTTPPQQAKMINETEKRLNMLFDLINCEALSENSTEKILEICRAIESRNQALALDLHLSLLTTSNDVAPFQAALKLVIQRAT